MLRVYEDVRVMQLDARRLCEAIRRHDLDLARQLRRAAQSVALNMAEGMAARDGNRRKAYETALREARECMAAVDLAACWGYVTAQPRVVDRLDKIVGSGRDLVLPLSSLGRSLRSDLLHSAHRPSC